MDSPSQDQLSPLQTFEIKFKKVLQGADLKGHKTQTDHGALLPNIPFFDTPLTDFYDNLTSQERKAFGTSIPYLTQMMGDWVINPSSVSLTTFQKMCYADPTIGGCLDYNIAIVAESIDDYFNKNKEIQKKVRRAVSKLDGGLKPLIRKMLTFLWAGFFVGEKVLKWDEETDMNIVDYVLPLPPLSILFRIDFQGRVRDDQGIFQYVLNAFNAGYANAYAYGNIGNVNGTVTTGPDAFASQGDIDYPYRTVAINPVGLVAIPKSNVIYVRNEGVDGFENPYGRSLLRRIYSMYLMKSAILQFLMLAYDKKSTPLIAVYADGTQSILNPNSNNPQDTISAVNAVLPQLEGYRGQSVLVFPGMKGQVYDIEAIKVEGDMTQFIDGLNWIEKQIQRGLLMPDTIFQGDKGGSYAESSMQNNVHNKLLGGFRSIVIQALMEQYVKPMILTAYDEEDVEDFGYFKEKILSLDDKLKMAKLYETLISNQVVSAQMLDDCNTMREVLDFNQLNEQELSKIGEKIKDLNIDPTKTNVKESGDHYKNQAYGDV